jgi:hypothetical protein
MYSRFMGDSPAPAPAAVFYPFGHPTPYAYGYKISAFVYTVFDIKSVDKDWMTSGRSENKFDNKNQFEKKTDSCQSHAIETRISRDAKSSFSCGQRKDSIGVRRGVSKRVENGRWPYTLWVGHPRNGCKSVSGVALPKGVEGSGMAGPCETLGSPRPPLAIHL